MNKVIDKIEFIVKTDIRYLAKGSFWLGIAQAASALSSFILAVVLAHMLSQSTLGEYKFIITVSGIIESLGLSGIGIALVQSVARGHEGTLSIAFKENLRWSFLMLTTCIGVAIYYSLKHNTTYAALFVLIGLLLPFIKSFTLWSPYLNAKKKFETMSILHTLFAAAFCAVLIGTVFVTAKVVNIVAVYFITSLFLNALLYLVTKKLYPIENTSSEKRIVAYAAHLSIMGVLHTLADRIDLVLIFLFMGPTNLAIFSFALAMPEQIKGFAKNFSSVIFPKFALKNIKSLQSMILRRTLEITAIAILITCAYIVAAPFIFKFLFPQYIASVFYSQIYCLSLIPVTASMLTQTALRSLASKRQLYILNISASLILISSVSLGVWKYGIWGAIGAITITRIYRAICGYVLLKRIRPENMPTQNPDSTSKELLAPTI